MEQGGGAYQERAEPSNESIGYSQTRCPLSGPIEDDQLMFHQYRLSNYRTNAARPSESSKSNDEMNEKNHQITHLGIVSEPQNVGNSGPFVIRQEQVPHRTLTTRRQTRRGRRISILITQVLIFEVRLRILFVKCCSEQIVLVTKSVLSFRTLLSMVFMSNRSSFASNVPLPPSSPAFRRGIMQLILSSQCLTPTTRFESMLATASASIRWYRYLRLFGDLSSEDFGLSPGSDGTDKK